jgi:hypothetical protein
VCLFTAHVGGGSSPLSCGVFHPPPVSQAFLLLDAGLAPLLLPEPLWPTQLVYLQFWEGFPSLNLQYSLCPTLFPTCLYCSYGLLLSFSFFPWVEVCLSRGLCCSGPGLSVGVPQYCSTHLVRIFPSHLCAGNWWPRDPPGFSFNMKWRCSVLAGGVGGSKFCLFSVVLPARCVSSISPRFHYRRHAFCFLPLAAIFPLPLKLLCYFEAQLNTTSHLVWIYPIP